MSPPLQSILLDQARLEGDFLRFAIESRESTPTGEKSGVAFYRVPRLNVAQFVARIAALEHEEENEPVAKFVEG